MRLMALALLAGVAACLGESAATADAPVFTDDPAAPLLVGAGDIAYCSRSTDEATARLLDRIPGTVFTVGDHVYPTADAAGFDRCYAPTWGRHRDRTRPSPGNHEWDVEGGAPYFAYFGENAGPPGRGYYSYELGAWHVVVLNSNIDLSAGSTQLEWLRNDLAATSARCVLAYWHHPRFTSSRSTPNPAIEAAWQALYESGAEVVLGGHEHNYERFAPQTPAGTADSARGIRQFVVGTGGARMHTFGAAGSLSEKRGITFGVLVFKLHPDRYEWRFVPALGGRFEDSGSAPCH
jgi:hypothetical protein